MNTSRTTLSLLLALVLTAALLLCGCDGGEPAPASTPTASVPAPSSEEPASEPGSTVTSTNSMTFYSAVDGSDASAAPSSQTPASQTPPAVSSEPASAAPSSTASAPVSAPAELPADGSPSGIAATARALIGTAYELGAAGPDTFDNPGLVHYCCKQNGVTVPLRAGEIAAVGQAVSREDLQPGDIVVFANDVGGSAAFVGIYVGDGHFIACNKPGDVTKEQTCDSAYWSARFLSGRRVG